MQYIEETAGPRVKIVGKPKPAVSTAAVQAAYGSCGRNESAQFWAPPKPFMASVMPAGLSMIWEKRTTVTVSCIETERP